MTRIGAKCTALGKRYIAVAPTAPHMCNGCAADGLQAKADRLCEALDDCTGDSKQNGQVIWVVIPKGTEDDQRRIR